MRHKLPAHFALIGRSAMANLEYDYVAHYFRPRQGSDQRLLLFVAPASDIRSWAGVPRKAFDYQHGFQRT
jgi:hypothetical protein